MEQSYEQLLSRFKQYSFSTTDDLIKDVIVAIGRRRSVEKLNTDERETAYKFWYRLDTLSSGFNFEEACADQSEAPLIELSKQELAQEKALFVAEFSRHPYEEALDQLVEAAYEWLLCPSMQGFKKDQENDRVAKLRYCKEWGLEMGVV